MKVIHLLFFFCVYICLPANADQLPKWVTEKYGREYSNGYYTEDKSLCSKFIPSGILESEIKHFNLEIKIYHAIYYSNEENPDTSKDQQSSIEIYKNNERIFVGRGYKFAEIGIDSQGYGSIITFTHWTGVMGQNQITVFRATLRDDVFKLDKVSTYSTKTWTGLINDGS